ncbi:hypothetical protein [Sinorhizobium meliloti]|uniref:hypothetical protein n=1 Tax=Rhizobium meliloti TaxID=382 RepID=UPI0018657503|nr:hypothetical protein [Sinorhizobium meliloti]
MLGGGQHFGNGRADDEPARPLDIIAAAFQARQAGADMGKLALCGFEAFYD